ncbi:hypothetical protein [Thiocystis violascens]|uniref:Uncharacterized protein n=1 Tax=Thiocystis violascens (strain ATCC 17096 / DSM 198 / 6111) TaxID=765911 RepID=I3Y5E6_THIV6|nr:hypothetical protein [Thiocystis violascens]AFL72214.1 hypothetical protein Thivi_0138 [Thiocystis violascens DSM 198]
MRGPVTALPRRPFGASAVLLFGVLLLLAGCATTTSPALEARKPAPGTEVAPPPEGGQIYWWYSRFRLAWPDGEPAPWHPDLLLADLVIRPILETERDRIPLWRFHRRAARDAAGRQFSFIYRATPAMARRIQARIDADPQVACLLRKGTLLQVSHDDPAQPQRPGIGDTSDPAWPPEMQRAWPHFILGASQLWLELIRELGQSGKLPRGTDAHYAALNEQLETLWRDQGGHALLHHLSAVFGYRELLVTSRGLLKL